MDDTDANAGVETSFERARLLITMGWAAKVAGFVIVWFYFWIGVLFFAVSWGLDASVFPARPAPGTRDYRLKWAMLGFGVLFLCGWIAGMIQTGRLAPAPALTIGLIGIIVCEFSRYVRADIEYLRKLRECESAPPAIDGDHVPSPADRPATVQEELPL